jgi:hypothetical protein
MKKHILKALICLSSVLFISCEKDGHTREFGESRVNKFTLQDIPELNEFINSQKTMLGRNAATNLLDSIVPGNVIVVEELDGTKSYTFALSIVEPDTQMTNLVINETTDGFEYFTLTYKSENLQAWKQEVNNKQVVTVPVEITKNTIDAGLMGRGGGGCIGGASYTYECPSGKHSGSVQGDCDYVHSSWNLIITVLMVPCEDDGGGAGAGGGSSTSPNTGGSAGSAIVAFANSLNVAQKAWWDNLNHTASKSTLTKWLNTNGYTASNVNFAKWAIDYLRTNPSVTMAQFQNWYMSPSQGQDFIYDSSFWNNPANLNFQQQSLPSYNDFLDGFPQNGSGEFLTGADNIFSLVGGDVQQVRLDYPGNQTKNVCALKVSIALNNSGVVVPNIPNQTIEGGGDYAGKYFFLNVRALNNWMRATFGTSNPNDGFPDNQNHISFTGQEGGKNGENYPTLAAGLKGIYMLVMPTGSNLSGHADVINNNYCPGNCNFQLPVEHIDIWVLN